MTRNETQIAKAIGAIAIMAIMMAASPADARNLKHGVATPPPPFGYYGRFPLELDSAQAQAVSLEEPYYRRFLYDYCDYRNCELRRTEIVNPDGSRSFDWAPVWYGPKS